MRLWGILLGLFLWWSTPVWALHYTDLYAYLPDKLPGFEAQEPQGSVMQAFGAYILNVERSYQGPGRSLKVQITSGPTVASIWLPFAMQISYDTPEERMETIKVQGFPAKMIVRKKSLQVDIYVLLTPAGTPGALAILQFEGLSPEEAQKYLSYFKFREIAQKFTPDSP